MLEFVRGKFEIRNVHLLILDYAIQLQYLLLQMSILVEHQLAYYQSLSGPAQSWDLDFEEVYSNHLQGGM